MKKNRFATRQVRHARIRKKVFGTAERPRICVFRSAKHIYVQAIDDTQGHTLAAADSIHDERPEVHSDEFSGKSKAALAVGLMVAQKLKAKGIQHAVFDRGGYLYHGRVAALAQGVRDGGITI